MLIVVKNIFFVLATFCQCVMEFHLLSHNTFISSNMKVLFSSKGTSDEHISIIEVLKDCNTDGAILVTTPQVSINKNGIFFSFSLLHTIYFKKQKPLAFFFDANVTNPAMNQNHLFPSFQNVSTGDVRREVTFCRKTKTKILGIVENMSGFVCSHCSVCISISFFICLLIYNCIVKT